ncbi:MAG: hypothetical protein A3E01_18435 [Gammaproteobacteria bacterium RIFCSPHIGHO2_12_FULL_63_22]|nr:MAG: hypothetical protein A3E01_18435 [Gammaproteobacteria bacterium RIFCSPHIGHO2_12_FULL_63_22]
MAVENLLETSDWLSMECARLLTNELFVSAGMNNDWAKDFDQPFPIGDTARIPFPWRPIGGEGMDYDPEPIVRRHTDVTVDKVPHVHFEWGSVEQALKLTRGREKVQAEILKPAMQKMRQKIELLAARHAAINSPNVLGTLGTDPTTLGFAGQARTRLIQMAGWMGAKRTAALSPSVMESITQAATVTNPIFNPTDKIAKAFVEGYLGENGGWQFAESMSLLQITAGTRAGAISISATAVSGATSLVIACTEGDTFVAGEKFGVAGRYPVNPGTLERAMTTTFQFAIAGDPGQTYTATAATITLPITDTIYGPADPYQNITVMPTAGDVVTPWPGTTTPNGLVGTLSVLFSRDAFTIVPVKLANPEQGGSVQIATQNRDPRSGVSVAVIRMFEPIERRWVNRFDALLGIGNLYNRNASVVLAGA